MDRLTIESPRLKLIAADRELLTADLSGMDALCAQLRVEGPSEWPPEGSEYDEGAVRFFLQMISSGGERAAGWYTWYAILRAGEAHAARLVGNGGFFGTPDDHGSVEIGYSVCTGSRGAGIATEIVAALLEYAWSKKAVKRVVARTRPENSSSIGALRRSGFYEIASDDPEKLKFECLRPSNP
jgi:RimJ/RimL family protein N-acetyltransferase